MSDIAVDGSFHPGLKSGCLGGENGGLDFWKMEGRGGVLGETTMSGLESGSCSSLGGDFGGESGSNDMWLSELRPGLERGTLGGSEGVLGVFLRLCVLCRTVCVVDACWSGDDGDSGRNNSMELRFDQFGREEFQFLSRSCSISSSTEALLLFESAGDAAREDEEEVIESYRGRDPTEGRVD